MSRYDGLIIPRSYSEYINKTDAATLQQALQLSGVLSGTVAAGDNKAVKSSAVNNVLANYMKFGQIIANIDLDDIKTAGFYKGVWNNDCTNKPSNYDSLMEFSLEVIDDFYPKQVFRGRDNFIAIRTYDNNEQGNYWHDWEEIAKKNETARFPNYSDMQTVNQKEITTDQDIYIVYLITTANTDSTTYQLYINNTPVAALDNYGEMRIVHFAGYAKKGDIIKSNYLTRQDLCKIYSLR